MILFDKNLDGTTEYFNYDELTDTTTITTVQNVSSTLDRLKSIRNETGDKSLIKEEFWFYATIPQIVEIELRNKGINLYDKNDTKRILQEINQNYPYLKSTNKKHA
jgi:hypothetical protein